MVVSAVSANNALTSPCKSTEIPMARLMTKISCGNQPGSLWSDVIRVDFDWASSTGRDLAGSDDESDIEGLSWDGLLIEDDNDETIYCFD